MFNIGVIGCGKWSEKVINEIKSNNKFKFNSLVCKNENLSHEYKDVKCFKNIESLFSSKINDCIYVAAMPQTNLNVVQEAVKNNIPLIIEKPISDSYLSAIKLSEISNNNNLIVLPNVTNFFSENFLQIKNFIKKNINNIEKIILYEGSFGPFRKQIHPIWDWGFHPLSLLINCLIMKIFQTFLLKKLRKIINMIFH